MKTFKIFSFFLYLLTIFATKHFYNSITGPSILYLFQIFIALGSVIFSFKLKRSSNVSHISLLALGLIFLAEADISYFVFSYIEQIDPGSDPFSFIVTSVPYSLSSIFFVSHQLRLQKLHPRLNLREFVFLFPSLFLLLLSFPLIFLPIFAKIESGGISWALASIVLSTFSSLILIFSASLGCIRFVNLPAALLAFGLLIFGVTDWLIQFELLNFGELKFSNYDLIWLTAVYLIFYSTMILKGDRNYQYAKSDTSSFVQIYRAVLILFLLVFTGSLGFCLPLSDLESLTLLGFATCFGTIFVCLTSIPMQRFLVAFSDSLGHVLREKILKNQLPAMIKYIPTELKEPLLITAQAIQEKQEDIWRLESQKLEGFSKIASQVAHDIRSPLSALNMVSSSLKEVPEEKRLLIRNAIQRINDIANDLLTKGKQAAEKSSHISTADPVAANASMSSTAKHEVILLPALVDSLVSEKRIQFRDQINVVVESDLKDSFGAFVSVDGKELMRLLSNLINNAVEAFANQTGEVIVAVRAFKDSVQLSLRDNGRGIPPEVLQRLGEAGVTHGKEGTQSGSGLGVYHAKKTVEAAGGRINISSQIGVGTMIDIQLPRVAAPIWFSDAISLASGMEVISLDDDLTIHGIWRGRLESLHASQKNISVRNFTSAKDFKAAVKSLSESELTKKVFLVDFELLGQSTTGLDVIQELGLQQNVVLVTSRYEEQDVKRRCESLKIKLLPKSLAGFVPINLESD